MADSVTSDAAEAAVSRAIAQQVPAAVISTEYYWNKRWLRICYSVNLRLLCNDDAWLAVVCWQLALLFRLVVQMDVLLPCPFLLFFPFCAFCLAPSPPLLALIGPTVTHGGSSGHKSPDVCCRWSQKSFNQFGQPDRRVTIRQTQVSGGLV